MFSTLRRLSTVSRKARTRKKVSKFKPLQSQLLHFHPFQSHPIPYSQTVYILKVNPSQFLIQAFFLTFS